MAMAINHNPPRIMHVDLNSFFARMEQQTRPHLRGRPVVVAAYTTPSGCVVAPSVEAKQYGIKTGMTVREACLLCKELAVLPPDPPKYRDGHIRLKRLLADYSSVLEPKSIDEVVVDFSVTGTMGRDLVEIGREIKALVKTELGEWMTCNIGIGPNRFLAKLAAGLHKPDGLDLIAHQNLREVYASVKLTDLNGINTRYEARLNAAGIFTPLEFLDAPLPLLRHAVFQSIVGYYWYLRLRGWEPDDVIFDRQSFGQSYSLGEKTADDKTLAALLAKLTEKMGWRLRQAGYSARGVHVSVVYADYTHWHHGQVFHTEMYASQELFKRVLLVFNSRQFKGKAVAKLGVSCFELKPAGQAQPELFDTGLTRQHHLSDALDHINGRYGPFTIHPALMLGLDEQVIDRISFGSVKDVEDVYTDTCARSASA